jgi:hypothetical protein
MSRDESTLLSAYRQTERSLVKAIEGQGVCYHGCYQAHQNACQPPNPQNE